MTLCTSIFLSAALSLHAPCPVTPIHIPERPSQSHFILASRTPRIVGAPQDENRSLRKIRRAPDKSFTGWYGGAYAL